MPFVATAKNTMLDAITFDRVKLHDGLPGSAGTDNEASGLVAATFNAASSGERELDADVEFSGLGANHAVTHFSVWTNSGTVYRGYGVLAGDQQANAAGEYTLLAGTVLTLSDP